MAGTSKAAPTNGAAARTETSETPKTITFRELTLTLPAELPTTLLFDIAALEASGENPMPVFRLLLSLLGDEQFHAVRNTMKPTDDLNEAIDSLLDLIFEQYGISVGESSASATS